MTNSPREHLTYFIPAGHADPDTYLLDKSILFISNKTIEDQLNQVLLNASPEHFAQ